MKASIEMILILIPVRRLMKSMSTYVLILFLFLSMQCWSNAKPYIQLIISICVITYKYVKYCIIIV